MNDGDRFWSPELLWQGQTVFVLGGGPSLAGFDFDRLRDRTVIAVNMSAYDAPFAAAWVFMDANVFAHNQELIARWEGLIVTTSRSAKAAMPERIRRVKLDTREDFPPAASGFLRHGRSSGHMAVSLAQACGAARVVLLGFDMRVEQGADGAERPHYHNRYRRGGERAPVYRDEFIPGFAGWHAAGLAAGCSIVNATPGSALREFPMVDLADELGTPVAADTPSTPPPRKRTRRAKAAV